MFPPIVKLLGPAVEKSVKLRLPAVFREYIQEIAIKQNYDSKDLTVDEYCTEEILKAMIAHLDGDEEIVLPSKLTIPRAIAYKHNEIINTYLGG